MSEPAQSALHDLARRKNWRLSSAGVATLPLGTMLAVKGNALHVKFELPPSVNSAATLHSAAVRSLLRLHYALGIGV